MTYTRQSGVMEKTEKIDKQGKLSHLKFGEPLGLGRTQARKCVGWLS